jgi:AcrR family transcriptional regulator
VAVSRHSPAALRADAARNRERIIAAAAEVFAERGLDASTAEVAQRAGVGEATLFRRFPHKLDLVDAILEAKMSESIEMIADCAADPDPARGLRRFLVDFLETKMQHDQGYLEAMHDRCMTNPASSRSARAGSNWSAPSCGARRRRASCGRMYSRGISGFS